MKKVQYVIEAFALRGLFAGLRALPLDVASSFGGMLGRTIGPFFSAHRTALANLRMVFPEKTEKECRAIRARMWEHLGRVGAEYAFLHGNRLSARIEVTGAEHLPKQGQATLMFSGHIGNWELLCPIAFDRGVELAIVYRHTNNPIVDKTIADIRHHHASELINKSSRGGVKILSALKRGASVAMLIDQKTNNGIPVPLFGREAMTSPAIAEIALKYDIPIIPARVVRVRGAHFKGIIYPPLSFEKTGDHKQDVMNVMNAIHAMLESWIREYPEQWFWVHRRWGKV